MGQDMLRQTASSPGGDCDPFRGRLLYVEDNLIIAETTCQMLEDSGFEVVQAYSAEEALRVAEADGLPFDLVLTDVVMPGLSGIHLARRLNRHWPYLPVILVSGYGDQLALGYASPYELLNKP